MRQSAPPRVGRKRLNTSTLGRMLLRHGFHYLLARGVPGALNFLAIAIYTRLLTPTEYGAYTLTIAAVAAVDAILLQWLRLVLLRYLPQLQAAGKPEVALSTVLRMFLWAAAITSGAAVIGTFIFIDSTVTRQIVVLGAAIFVVQGLFELTVERERSALLPRRYGLYAGMKSVLGLLVGTALALMGWGAKGLLIGLVASMALPLITLGGLSSWSRVGRARFDRGLARQALSYGLPLAATSALAFVVSTSDRFMLAGFLDQAAAGRYAVGYDLSQFTIGMLLSIVNLAAYPLIVAALDTQGEAAAREILLWAFRLLCGIGVPATVGLAVLAPNVAHVMVGGEFSDVAASIIPSIAIAAFVSGFKAFYLDLAFQLSRNTIVQVWIVLLTALLNVALNLWWIPILGIPGAVYATLVAHLVAAGLAWSFGRRAFPVPVPVLSLWPMLTAATGMGIVLHFIRPWTGFSALALQVGAGLSVYAILLWILDRRFFGRIPS